MGFDRWQGAKTKHSSMEINFALTAGLGDYHYTWLLRVWLFHGGKPITIVHEAGAPFRHQGERSAVQFALFR